MTNRLLLLTLCWLSTLTAQDQGKIVRPEESAALPPGEISIIATAPGGKLELDGRAIPTEEPFPNVLYAKSRPAPGEHVVVLVWEGGRREMRFFVGDDPPVAFQTFRSHPPAPVECTHCHGLSRRGRFRFQGGCFDCHQQEGFSEIHGHRPHILEQCGQCHNAHGSSAKALLILPRETACKLCHN